MFVDPLSCLLYGRDDLAGYCVNYFAKHRKKLLSDLCFEIGEFCLHGLDFGTEGTLNLFVGRLCRACVIGHLIQRTVEFLCARIDQGKRTSASFLTLPKIGECCGVVTGRIIEDLQNVPKRHARLHAF